MRTYPAYLAITLAPEDYGAVVYNFSPYYQEDEGPSRLCDSFGELTNLLRWATLRNARNQDVPIDLFDFTAPGGEPTAK